jgi:uncharacterized protein YndB with AHSA1/START domain
MSIPFELVITRSFDAPRELIFNAFTQPEHLENWWVTKGFTMKIKKHDLRPGGVLHYRQESPEGHEMWVVFNYQEVVRNEKLAFITSFSDEEAHVIRAPFSEAWPLEILNTFIFTEENGKTTVTMTGAPVNPTEEELETFMTSQEMIRIGYSGIYSLLDEYLDKLK